MSQAALNALLTYQANQENAKNQRYNDLWDSYMNQFGSGGEGYQNLLNQRNAGLDSAFNDYYGTTAANTNEYTGGLSSLMDKLNSPGSQITFGLQGSDPVSFTNKSVGNDVSTLASLMADKANASNNLASSKYNYATNKANSILDFYNELKNTAAAAKSGDISNLIGTYGSGSGANDSVGALGTIGSLASLFGSTGQGAAGIAQLIKSLSKNDTKTSGSGTASSSNGGDLLSMWTGGDADVSGLIKAGIEIAPFLVG